MEREKAKSWQGIGEARPLKARVSLEAEDLKPAKVLLKRRNEPGDARGFEPNGHDNTKDRRLEQRL